MMQKTFRKTGAHRRGFSLMEVVISVGVLAIGLVGVMSMYADSLSRILSIRNQTTAGALAQEGVEFVRNRAEGDGSFDNVDTSKQRVYINGSEEVELDGSTAYTLQYSGNRFNHIGGGSDTRFSRRIVITEGDIDGYGDDDRRVRSFVTWGSLDLATATVGECNIANKCVYATMDLIAQ